MKKLILGSLAILLLPQVVVAGFFLMAGFVLGNGDTLRITYVVASGLALLICGVITTFALCGSPDNYNDHGWIGEYSEERKKEKERVEKFRQELDKQVGIPRIGR